MPSLKINFPCLRRLKLSRFSLYSANPDAEIAWEKGVLCIIGANGLGKSTLLSAINFALTGIVPEPSRDFKSMDEYYTYSRRYAQDYFKGRIRESDRAVAEIEIEFLIGNSAYSLRRGIFDSEELRELNIINEQTGEIIFDSSSSTRRERQAAYEQRLTEDMGLSSFPEFVFLQLFVLTFDERRTTLFWNSLVLERALYLAFGLSPDAAKTVDELKRDWESEDSNVRNRQYDATRTKKRIIELMAQAQLSQSNTISLQTLSEQHDALITQNEELLKKIGSIRKQQYDCKVLLAALSAKESSLRDEYSRVFAESFAGQVIPSKHPLVLQSLSDKQCGLCGASGDAVIATFHSRVNSHNCPLCDSEIKTPEAGPVQNLGELQRLDGEIAKTKLAALDAAKELERISPEEAALDEMHRKCANELRSFEEKHETTMLELKRALSSNGNAETLLASYQSQYAGFMEEKKKAEDARSALRRRLNDKQAELQRQYLSVEKDFVPIFTELAHHFLGMSLDIKMTSTEAGGIGLYIEVRGTARRDIHQLSESQRFFLDIALRMALAQFVSSRSAPASLTIDTPEGSLDIAYEKRAGEMLAKFVSKGHRVIMTANLNSSRLLIALAKSCTRTKMTLCKMTEWAELSEVQRSEEQLFVDAYAAIEAELN